jgi:hypothetical protein
MSLYFYQPQIATIPLLQVEEPLATLDRSRSVNSDKLKKVIKTLLNMPDMKVPQAMLLARFSNESPCIASSSNLSLAKWWRAWRRMFQVLFRHYRRNLITVSGFAIAPSMTIHTHPGRLPCHWHWRMWAGHSGDALSLAASAACFCKASRMATIMSVYINGGSEKVEKLG